MSKRNPLLPTPLKPCPRCHGSGQIPCNGTEIFRERQQKWAEGFVGKMVAIEVYNFETRKFDWIPGIATGVRIAAGGWPQLAVHLAVSAIPTHDYWLPETLQNYHWFYNEFDAIDGKAYWYETLSDPKVIRVFDEQIIPAGLAEIQKMQGMIGAGVK